jgi:hypothetical protein
MYIGAKHHASNVYERHVSKAKCIISLGSKQSFMVNPINYPLLSSQEAHTDY